MIGIAIRVSRWWKTSVLKGPSNVAECAPTDGGIKCWTPNGPFEIQVPYLGQTNNRSGRKQRGG